MEESKILRSEGYVGFADIYRKKCDKESKPNDEIDKKLYAELVKLDTRLGLPTIIGNYQLGLPTNYLGDSRFHRTGIDHGLRG